MVHSINETILSHITFFLALRQSFRKTNLNDFSSVGALSRVLRIGEKLVVRAHCRQSSVVHMQGHTTALPLPSSLSNISERVKRICLSASLIWEMVISLRCTVM